MATASTGMPAAPPSGFGRTFLIGGSIVFATLSGFYMNMLHNKRKQEAMGTNPHFEQVVGHVSRPPARGEPLQPIRAQYSDMPPALPGKDHYSGHTTFVNYRQSPGYAEAGESIRHMVPPPQRAKHDGSGQAYTKSPNYVQNYGKTQRPPPIVKEPTVDI